jgi:hypothetical protein
VLRRLDFAQIAIQFKKHVLSNLLGQPAIARHAQGERKHHGLMQVHQQFEIRLPIVRHGFRFYFLIRRNCGERMQRVRTPNEKVHRAYRGE